MTSRDETDLYERLLVLPPFSQAVFTAACSQRLGAMCSVLGTAWAHPVPAVFDEAQHAVWAMCAGQRHTSDIDELDAAVSAHVPHDDDEDWDRFSGYLQSVGISLLHAILAAGSPDPERAVFAARQLVEVVDFSPADLRDTEGVATADDLLLAVQQGLDEDLTWLEADTQAAHIAIVEQARHQAVREGERLGHLLVAALHTDD